MQHTEFKFICPDKPGTNTKNIRHYLKVANTNKELGVPNYNQVRLPIK